MRGDMKPSGYIGEMKLDLPGARFCSDTGFSRKIRRRFNESLADADGETSELPFSLSASAGHLFLSKKCGSESANVDEISPIRTMIGLRKYYARISFVNEI